MLRTDTRKRNTDGDADVPETEAPDAGVAKFSVDYFKMLSSDEGDVPYSIAIVNRGDGWIFSYAAPAKGIQGDSYWVPTRLAKDTDNCGTQFVTVQVNSDQGPATVNVQEEIRHLRQSTTVCTFASGRIGMQRPSRKCDTQS